MIRSGRRPGADECRRGSQGAEVFTLRSGQSTQFDPTSGGARQLHRPECPAIQTTAVFSSIDDETRSRPTTPEAVARIEGASMAWQITQSSSEEGQAGNPPRSPSEDPCSRSSCPHPGSACKAGPARAPAPKAITDQRMSRRPTIRVMGGHDRSGNRKSARKRSRPTRPFTVSRDVPADDPNPTTRLEARIVAGRTGVYRGGPTPGKIGHVPTPVRPAIEASRCDSAASRSMTMSP